MKNSETNITANQPHSGCMQLEISTYLDCSPERAWQELKKPSLLSYVAHPLIRFEPVEPSPLPKAWPGDGVIRLKVYLFGVIPFGGIRTLSLHLDDETKQLQSYEHDKLIRCWDHLIKVERDSNGRTRYTDRLELEAGLLTLPVWLFACIFYHYRQWRWRGLSPRLSR